MWLNPALRRYPSEAALLGHMLLAYGELELMVSECLCAAIESQDDARRMMFRIMGETSRIQATSAIMRRTYVAAGLGAEFDQAIGAVEYCITVRNLFAHCHWADHAEGGLFFTSLQDPAKATESFDYWYRHVDVPLLTELAEYFDYAAESLQFIQFELRLRQKKIKCHAFPMPKVRIPPKKHNPPAEHIPPWLDQGGQRRHIERTQEQEALDRSRREKRETMDVASHQKRVRAVGRRIVRALRHRYP